MPWLWLREEIPGAGEGCGKRKMEWISQWACECGRGPRGAPANTCMKFWLFILIHIVQNRDGNLVFASLPCVCSGGWGIISHLSTRIFDVFLQPTLHHRSALRPKGYFPGTPRYPNPLEPPGTTGEEGRLTESLGSGRPFSGHMQVCRIYIDRTQLQVINKVD